MCCTAFSALFCGCLIILVAVMLRIHTYIQWVVHWHRVANSVVVKAEGWSMPGVLGQGGGRAGSLLLPSRTTCECSGCQHLASPFSSWWSMRQSQRRATKQASEWVGWSALVSQAAGNLPERGLPLPHLATRRHYCGEAFLHRAA